MELPKRKRNRLIGFDYSSNGAYYLTICVKERRKLLAAINVGAHCVRPGLSDIGQVVENEIDILSNTYPGIYVDKFVIMPNHIHVVLVISGRAEWLLASAASESGRTQCAPTVSRIIKQFKGAITKRIGHSIWQRSYYDHIIRNEADYLRAWQYIDENPAKWEEDEYFVRD